MISNTAKIKSINVIFAICLNVSERCQIIWIHKSKKKAFKGRISTLVPILTETYLFSVNLKLRKNEVEGN